ncbi:MAG: biopolymer transporter ExbD [Planctomycetes bacterium]|nr:biopolymer transporter ExbD [Planctomycetota bacterium]
MSAIDDAQEEAKADMTPMIDVVFLMIIFFICIEFKVLESKLDAFLPTDKGSQSTVVEPEEQLTIKIHVESKGVPDYSKYGGKGLNPGTGRPNRFALVGHKVKWEIGPKPVYTLQAVKDELTRIANDPASQIPDKKTGGRKLMSCVIEAYPGTYYEDVAKTNDAANAAGFTEVNFGGGLGPGK